MKKADLKSGMILEIRSGSKYLYIEGMDILYNINCEGYLKLCDYDYNLIDKSFYSDFNNNIFYSEFDIIKIYFKNDCYTLNQLLNNTDLIWQREEFKKGDIVEVWDNNSSFKFIRVFYEYDNNKIRTYPDGEHDTDKKCKLILWDNCRKVGK